MPGSGGDFHSVRTVPVDDDGDLIIPGGVNGGLFLRGTHGMMIPFLEIKVDSIDFVDDGIVATVGEIVKDRSPILGICLFRGREGHRG